MNADIQREVLDQVTSKIIGCAHAVSNTLGPGFLEKVYENALRIELGLAGLQASQQPPIAVRYRGRVVGDYIPDLVVEGCVIVEVKAVLRLDSIHRAQCINYLKATSLSVALLMNFALPRLDVRRIVHDF